LRSNYYGKKCYALLIKLFAALKRKAKNILRKKIVDSLLLTEFVKTFDELVIVLA
jgi:hypothetical protein